ncbi:hypothetical protein FNV43_RR04419 [Rhamnella rubrinervis]|uniref:Uncharacterized protein n=1 Tax=Rhamnella rubrinervis TaxID=2594499 RepID=A0A8K0HJI8_9ROSA|nr:hypothetical protein FNV43_RR04419 [Rhamnella rubrinervis]
MSLRGLELKLYRSRNSEGLKVLMKQKLKELSKQNLRVLMSKVPYSVLGCTLMGEAQALSAKEAKVQRVECLGEVHYGALLGCTGAPLGCTDEVHQGALLKCNGKYGALKCTLGMHCDKVHYCTGEMQVLNQVHNLDARESWGDALRKECHIIWGTGVISAKDTSTFKLVIRNLEGFEQKFSKLKCNDYSRCGLSVHVV